MLKRLDSYHITYPARVRRDGSHLTHHLSRTYDVTPVAASDVSRASLGDIGRSARRRRSLRQQRRRRRRRDAATHYRLQLGPDEGQDVVLDLLPNRRVLAPGFVIERRADVSQPGRIRRPTRHCLLHGRLRRRARSRVALSTCGGLVSHSPA